MILDKRYQVFVSSTYSDLSEEREYVIHELNKVGFIAVGMEQFPATDEEQMDYIKPIIDESDYYVVIIRGKYGSIGSHGISFTEKEFQYATSIGKPALGFLYKNPGSLRLDETDQDAMKMGKLTAFRSSLENKKIVRYWNGKDELVSAVKDTIHDQVRRKPGIGWIRGDQAIDPKVYKELEEVRQENAKLRDLLAKSDLETVAFPSHLSSGGDIVTVKFLEGDQEKESTISWDEIFDLVIEQIYNEMPETSCIWPVLSALSERSTAINPYTNLELAKFIRHQFLALGLIDTIVKEHIDSSRFRSQDICWCFTLKGRRYASERNALKRTQLR